MDEKKPRKRCPHPKTVLSAYARQRFTCVTPNLEEYECVKCRRSTHFRVLFTKHHDSEDPFRTLACSKCRRFITCSTLVLARHQARCTSAGTARRRPRRVYARHAPRSRYMFEAEPSKSRNPHAQSLAAPPRLFFKCDLCPFVSLFESAMRMHVHVGAETRAVEWLQCTACDFRTRRGRLLREHVQLRHSVVPEFRCDWCAFSTAYASNLRAHVLHRHIGVEKRFACESCAFSTNYQKNLANHAICFHTAEGSIQWLECEQCDFRAKTKNVFWRHMKTTHRGGRTWSLRGKLEVVMHDHRYALEGCDVTL